MIFALFMSFITGCAMLTCLGIGYQWGARDKRAQLVAGMDALLESEDLKIYVKKGSSFLKDGPR